MVVPGKWNYSMAPDSEAVIYFAREFELPDSWVNKDLTLFLGRIDDNDITYVNGNRVGGMGEYKNYHVPRAYSIPHSYLKRGNNRLMIRVNDRWLNGGLTGPQNSMRISDGRESIALAGEWRYKLIGTFRIPSTPTFDYSIRTPGVLYNAMLHPLINFAIKGAIWYQGEGNTSIAYEYRKLFPAMIRDWRSQWNQGDFPFLFVQLASYLPPAKEPQESEWAELREAQVMALALPNTGMAVTIDIGEADDIHPKNKADVGRRLALSARKVAYGEDVVYAGPMYQSMQKEGNKIRLTFTHTGGGLVAKGGNLRGFAIASKDGKFVWANARIEGSIVVVWHDKVKSPQAVRYAWGDNPQKANFYNLEGLPASPFRTDQWPGITEKKIVYPPEADKAVKLILRPFK
jgi:sialate O-acetylesterase